MNNSIWSQYIKKDTEKPLTENLEVHVLIIGGGITGLSTAYNLINTNLNVALVEKNKLFSAVTSKTTAKITYLQENIYSKLKTLINKNTSEYYYHSQIDAIKLLVKIIKENNIECDLEKVDSYLFSNKNNAINKIKKEKKLLRTFGVKLKTINKLPDKEECKYAIKVSDTYVFNPIKYLNELKSICKKNNIKIYENTNIYEIKKEKDYYICKTLSNQIKAKYVILALHYPYFLKPFFTPLKVTLEKSYISAFKYDKNHHFSAINLEKPTISIRYYENKKTIYKIKLTNSHNIAIKNNETKNFNNHNEIVNSISNYTWSNIDIKTSDLLPFIGSIDKNLIIATGYNTWGMTNATIAGKIIRDIVLNKKNKYIKLFNPKRAINLGKILCFPIILSSSAYSFINSKINLNKKLDNKIKIETKDNKKIATYIDTFGVEHKVFLKCPHLNCNLIFNEEELTWDCPCHGSRFNIEGTCIEGPSNYNITYKTN